MQRDASVVLASAARDDIASILAARAFGLILDGESNHVRRALASGRDVLSNQGSES
jgi:hypothetical protein